MKNNKNKLNPHFFRKMSNGLDIALMFYKTRLNPQQTQKGNTLLIGLGFGLLVMLLGGLAIAKANNNKINATSNEFTQKSLAITQAGVNNLMAQLNEGSNKSLLLLNNDPSHNLKKDDGSDLCTTDCNQWADPNEELQYSSGEVNSCSASSSSALDARNSIEGVVSAKSVGAGNGAGQFQLKGYAFQDGSTPPDADPTNDPNTGHLLVEGNLTPSTGSKSRFEVQIPVTVAKSATVVTAAALMAEEMKIGSPDIVTGSVTCTDPTPDNCEIKCDGNPTPTDDQLKAAIGVDSKNGGIVNDPIQVGGASIPPVPDVPANVIAQKRLYEVKTSGASLPIAGHQTVNGIYYYRLTAATINSSVSINTNNDIRIYVAGEIDFSGQNAVSSINTNVTPGPGQIRIYGADVNTTTGASILPSPSNYWELSGNSCIHGVIHAPNTYIGYNGGGNANACNGGSSAAQGNNFYGVVWVKGFGVKPDGTEWNGANTLTFNEQPGLTTLLTSEFGTDAFGPEVVTMGAGSTITRKEAN